MVTSRLQIALKRFRKVLIETYFDMSLMNIGMHCSRQLENRILIKHNCCFLYEMKQSHNLQLPYNFQYIQTWYPHFLALWSNGSGKVHDSRILESLMLMILAWKQRWAISWWQKLTKQTYYPCTHRKSQSYRVSETIFDQLSLDNKIIKYTYL